VTLDGVAQAPPAIRAIADATLVSCAGCKDATIRAADRHRHALTCGSCPWRPDAPVAPAPASVAGGPAQPPFDCDASRLGGGGGVTGSSSGSRAGARGLLRGALTAGVGLIDPRGRLRSFAGGATLAAAP
jgi:hypothetical protein